MTKMSVGFTEFRSNFGTLFACFIGMMFGVAAIPFYTLGVFAGPVTQDTGWTMQEFQTAFTFIILGTLFGPIIGHYCDRYGARLVATLSTIAFAASLALIGIIGQTSLYAFYAAWAVMAIVGQGTSPVIWTHVIGHNFHKNRGLAFGIVLAGSGVFAAFGPALAAFAIDNWGWQGGYLFFGFLVLLVPLPLVMLFLKPARAAKAKPASPQDIQTFAQHAGKTLGEALLDYRFYLIASSFFIIAFGVSGLISNMLPMLKSNGISLEDGTRLLGLIGIAVISGRIIMGALLDRFWAPLIAAIALLLPAFACLLLLDSNTGTEAAIAIILVGFAAGAEFDIVAFLASKYFGLSAYGKIYGSLYITLFIGAAIAPPIFGAAYDRDQSYEFLLSAFLFLFPIAALSLLTLGRYPTFEASN